MRWNPHPGQCRHPAPVAPDEGAGACRPPAQATGPHAVPHGESHRRGSVGSSRARRRSAGRRAADPPQYFPTVLPPGAPAAHSGHSTTQSHLSARRACWSNRRSELGRMLVDPAQKVPRQAVAKGEAGGRSGFQRHRASILIRQPPARHAAGAVRLQQRPAPPQGAGARSG